MAGIRSKSRQPSALVFDSFQSEAFTVGASIAAAQASTTLQGLMVLPFSAKIVQVGVYYTAIGTAQVGHLWNIVAGTGAYQTGTSGVPAIATLTVGGTFTAGQTVTAIIAGIPISITPVSGDTNNTGVAQRLAALINNTTTLIASGTYAGFPLNKVVGASYSAGNINVQAISCGTAGNSITVSVITNALQTLTTGSATLVNGANSVGITTNPVDTMATNQGIYTFATNGNAMFANDQSFPIVPNQSYGLIVTPTVWDGVYKAGTILTLRVTTPASTGSLSNLNVTLGLKSVDTVDTKSRLTFPGFNPNPDIG